MASLPDPELPQQESSSVQPFLRSDTQEFCQLLMELILHRAPSMLNPHSDPVPRTQASTPPLRDGDLIHDAGISVNDDDAYGDDGSGGFGAVPASGVAIVCLPDTVVLGEKEAMENAECAVCLEAYAVRDTLRTMPCSHGFHETCIFGWLRVSRFCPLCRFALPAGMEAGSDTMVRSVDDVRWPRTEGVC